jgi:hypothetical protein
MTERASGFRFRYSVEQTAHKGLGVFAREAIRKGSIVWHYVPGLYVVYDEASFRAKVESMALADIRYELTHVHGVADFPGCLIRVFDDGVLINHAGSPNLVTNNAGPATSSLDIASDRYLEQVTEALLDDRFALVATRDIEPGEEFTNDYVAEAAEPAFYDELYARHGVHEDYLDES